MNMGDALRQLVTGPIELLLDGIFTWALRLTGHPAGAIAVLSLAVSLLVLPLYRRADALERREREKAKALEPGVKLIREAFTGDERFMILKTYYRQNDYRPWGGLKNALSLLLQIPFFLAAYHYLSGLNVLQGAAFGPIQNLGAPDGLIRLGGRTINLLPFIMTGVNLISGALYARELTRSGKLQAAGLSLVFLVLLYHSPSGLVFYWTLNNVFSLGKNILRRFPDRGDGSQSARQGDGSCCPSGQKNRPPVWETTGTKEIPAAGRGARGRKGAENGVFAACSAALAALTGVLIPAAVIASSPAEFVEAGAFRSPLRLMLPGLWTAVGTFGLWCPVWDRLLAPRGRERFRLGLAIAAAGGFANYLFFGRYGNMTSLLRFEEEISGKAFPGPAIWNLLMLAGMGALLAFLWRKKRALVRALCFAECAAVLALSAGNTASVLRQLPEVERLAAQTAEAGEGIISLDRRGKNVIVLMLDKAIGAFVPCLFEERPALREQFAGFTAYPNTLSFGGHTNAGAPALFGGYAYTPERMNARKDLILQEKHNEALKVMPKIFLSAGFSVTVCDPPLANYQWIPDLSIYEDDPEIRTFLTEGRFNAADEARERNSRAVRERNFFRYSLFRTAPVCLQPLLYDGGNYNHADGTADGAAWDIFMRSYQALAHLPEMTETGESGRNTFLMMGNHTTHDVITLKEPEYEPVFGPVDNRAWDAAHPDRRAPDGSRLILETEDQRKHYQSAMAALSRIGEWLDTLRELGVLDNTRIILAADHGWDLEMPAWQAEKAGVNFMNYNPLLMVKDFDGKGPFRISGDFMTNADVPTLAFRGLVEAPVNPFTGEPVTDAEKDRETFMVCESPWQFTENNGTAFADARWFRLRNRDVRKAENWEAAEK